MNVILPPELKSSLIQNNLVVFLGAGVSYKRYKQQKKNTYYPLFRGLCKEIIHNLNIDLNEEQVNLFNEGAYDQLLGILNDKEYHIHKSASEILRENENVKDIRLHKEIIKLFPKGLDLRIVTTNFDNLIDISYKEIYENSDFPSVYEAPALFPGRARFKGICYLHGRVSNPKEMILTDRDIGRAYMDEGWALKFAHELFQNFAVLFIGYSLNDPPLRYLTLAISDSKMKNNKWALIFNSEDEEDWKRRGIEPVLYNVENESHRELIEIISDWSKENKKSFIDKRETLFQLIQSAPNTLQQHKFDLVINYIKIPELLRDMAKNGFHDGWFKVLEEQNYMEKLYQSEDRLTDSFLPLLARNLINILVIDTEKWILELGRYKESLNPKLFEYFCRKYESEPELELTMTKIRLIIEFFRPSIERGKFNDFGHSLGRLLKDLISFDLIDDAVWLLVSILDIDIKTSKSFNHIFDNSESNQEFTKIGIESNVTFKGQVDVYLFKKYKDDFFIPKVERTGYKLILALTNKFLNTLINIDRIKPIEYTYISRPFIEDSKEYFEEDVLNVFIDSMIEIWEEILKIDIKMAELITRQWEQFDMPYFKRLTLYSLNRLLELDYVQ